MEVRIRFMPNDKVWLMKNNKPVQQVVLGVRAFVYTEHSEMIIRVQYTFDSEHERYYDESELAGTLEQLKEKIFG